MVMIAVIGLIQPSELVRFWRLSKVEFWGAVVTAVSGLVFGLLLAVLIGVLLTLVLVIIELDRLGLTELQPTLDRNDVRAPDDHTQPLDGLLILRFDGPLYTANIRSVNRKVVEAVDSHPGVRVLVLDSTAVPQVTLTVVDEVLQLQHELDERHVELWFAGLPPKALATARMLPEWDALHRAGRMHPTSLAAVRAFLQH